MAEPSPGEAVESRDAADVAVPKAPLPVGDALAPALAEPATWVTEAQAVGGAETENRADTDAELVAD